MLYFFISPFHTLSCRLHSICHRAGDLSKPPVPLGHYECKLLRSLSHETDVTAYTCAKRGTNRLGYELTYVQNDSNALTEFHPT